MEGGDAARDPSRDAEDFEDRLFVAGCNDAPVSVINGAFALDFARTAKNVVPALATAIRDARRADGEVVRIEPVPM